MNPYDFVPIDFTHVPERHEPLQHHKFQGICGNLTGTITAETPIFIKRGESNEFQKNRQGKYIIPGTSLKGLFRSVAETVANGCFGGKFGKKGKGLYEHETKNYSENLPNTFKACINRTELCIACRIFGMLYKKQVFTGKISFQDAECNHVVPNTQITTVALENPKPHHSAFYLNGKYIAGRKFYFHHYHGLPAGNMNRGKKITPLGIGSQFTFTASFNNLEEKEWQALLYAIMLEDGMRHKIGYGKPSGLGSVKIDIEHIQLIDYVKRYTSANRGLTEYAGHELHDYIQQQILPFTSTTSATLDTLREIWRWNPNNTTSYHYPPTQWFTDHPNAQISETP